MLELLRVETPIFRPTASGKYPKPDVQQVGGRTLLKGVIIADVGPFRNSDRGEFDESGLRTAALLMRGGGQICYFSHPGTSGNMPHPYCGEWRNPRYESDALRADLLFSAAAGDVPNVGNVRDYVLAIAEENPTAINVSMRLYADQIPQGRGRSPLWKPLEIEGADLVGRGEATRSLLGATGKTNKPSAFERIAKIEADCARDGIRLPKRYTRAEAIAKADAILKGGR